MTVKITHQGCGWRGRDMTYEDNMLPNGWTNLVVFDDVNNDNVFDMRQIEGWRHDKVLCPKHARALDALLLQGTGSADPLSETIGQA